MDHNFEIRDILLAYFKCLPENIRGKFALRGSDDPKSLADFWEGSLTTDRPDGITDSFFYYETLNELQEQKEFVLSYNERDSLIYPYIVEKIFSFFSERGQRRTFEEAGIDDTEDLAPLLRGSTDMRNAFKGAFLEEISPPILSFLYSIVYLMGFSSGGESALISRVFPKIKGWEGHILDAGGGSGFAGLVVSTRGPVTYIDFSLLRAKRAKAICEKARSDPGFFDRLLNLVDLESGTFGLKLERNLIPPLTDGDIDFRSGDLTDLPKGIGPFDGAIMTDVLEHTTNPEAVLKNVAGAIKKGGRILITVPTDANGIRQKVMEDENGLTFPFLLHINFFSETRIKGMADAAGLAVEETHPYSYQEMTCSGLVPMEVMVIMKKI
jgi:SAM-dependent methyltransferase